MREKLNQHPIVASSAAAVLIGLCIFAAFRYFSKPADSLPTRAFFTTDDGKTWFERDLTSIPPFNDSGGTAVGCTVFAPQQGGTQFVGILTKFGDRAKADLDALVKSGASRAAVRQAMMDVPADQKLCKRPGDSDWSSASDAGAMMKLSSQIKAPDGSDNYMMVSP